MRRLLECVLLAAAIQSGTAFAAETPPTQPPAAQPTEPPPAAQSPPAPPSATPTPAPAQPPDEQQQAQPSGQPPGQPPPAPAVTPEGQWVYTSQYGWIWAPHAQAYTYVPSEGNPYMFVYYPAFGWRWVVAPWVFGWGPRPYWGALGPRHFAWYAHPWFRAHPRPLRRWHR